MWYGHRQSHELELQNRSNRLRPVNAKCSSASCSQNSLNTREHYAINGRTTLWNYSTSVFENDYFHPQLKYVEYVLLCPPPPKRTHKTAYIASALEAAGSERRDRKQEIICKLFDRLVRSDTIVYGTSGRGTRGPYKSTLKYIKFQTESGYQRSLS